MSVTEWIAACSDGDHRRGERRLEKRAGPSPSASSISPKAECSTGFSLTVMPCLKDFLGVHYHLSGGVGSNGGAAVSTSRVEWMTIEYGK